MFCILDVRQQPKIVIVICLVEKMKNRTLDEKKKDLLQICSRQICRKKKCKLLGKDGTFLMPHLYTSFTLGCKLGVKCGINHFCSHLLLSWYYFVIYLSKIGTIPVFRPLTHAWPAASKLPDNAKCRCLPYLLGMYVPRT